MADEQPRPIRNCDVCGISDTDPRHVYGLADGGTQTRHFDCCRDAGCPDGTCSELTAGTEDLRGDALLEHLTSQTTRSE